MLGKLKAGALPLEKLIITKSLRSGYKNPRSIAHKVLADRIGQRDQGNEPRPGDRMQFIYIKGAKKGLQGDRIETPAFIKAHDLPIDYSHYITNQVMKPLQQVFGLVLDEMAGYKPMEGTEKKVEQHKLAEVKRLVFADFL
jgi:DNA polymerase elongation subunit (family B)